MQQSRWNWHAVIVTALMCAWPAAASDHAPSAHGARSTPALSPRSAAVVTLADLIAGNGRFVRGKASHPHAGRDRLKELSVGQKPRVIVLSCADSRVPPEIVFDQGLGDIFTVRVAGQVLDGSTTSSIEYAVEHLGATLIVVMGHHGCGAVKAALTTASGKAGSRDLDELLDAIRPAVRKFGAPPADDKAFNAPVRANVDAVAAGLAKRSAIIRARVEREQLTIIPAVYELASGVVSFWDYSSPVAASREGMSPQHR